MSFRENLLIDSGMKLGNYVQQNDFIEDSKYKLKKKINDNLIREDEGENYDTANEHPFLSPQFKEYTMEEISKHNKKDDIWIIIDNGVYDVTAFWRQHPVNANLVYQFAGKDATEAYHAASHSAFGKQLAEQMKIGMVHHLERKVVVNRGKSVIDWYQMSQTKAEKPIRIQSISIYPVKGCKGVDVKSAVIEQNGLLNDRMYCIVDKDTRTVVNQLKYPKLARIQPVLNINDLDKTEDLQKQ